MVPSWAILVKLGGSGKPNCLSNMRQVAGAEIGTGAIHQVGMVVSIDDGDRLAGTISLDGAPGDRVDTVRRANLLWREAADRTGKQRL